MTDRNKIHDPVLGTLRLFDTDVYSHSGCELYGGEVDLTPKHRVAIEFTRDERVPLADGLARARAVYENVRLGERAYRLAAAAEFLSNRGDVELYFGEPGWTAERVAALMTLSRIDLHSSSSWVRLVYACKGDLGDGDLVATFDEEGHPGSRGALTPSRRNDGARTILFAHPSVDDVH